MPDIQLIISFEMLARTLSFSRAAERLHISQSTLSQRIGRLEQNLGVSLFERSSRHVHLTPEGKDLLPKAIQLIDRHADFDARALWLRNRSKRRVRLGMPLYAEGLPEWQKLSDALANDKQHEISHVIDWQANLLPVLERGDLDLLLVMGAPLPRDNIRAGANGGRPPESLFPAELPRCTLARRRVGLRIPRDSPLANLSTLRLADLAGYEIAVLVNTCPPVYERLEAALRACGALIRPATEGSANAVTRAAWRLGIPVVSIGWFDETPLTEATMTNREIADFDGEIELALVWHEPFASEAVKSFVNLACAHATDTAKPGIRQPGQEF